MSDVGEQCKESTTCRRFWGADGRSPMTLVRHDGYGFGSLRVVYEHRNKDHFPSEAVPRKLFRLAGKYEHKPAGSEVLSTYELYKEDKPPQPI